MIFFYESEEIEDESEREESEEEIEHEEREKKMNMKKKIYYEHFLWKMFDCYGVESVE